MVPAGVLPDAGVVVLEALAACRGSVALLGCTGPAIALLGCRWDIVGIHQCAEKTSGSSGCSGEGIAQLAAERWGSWSFGTVHRCAGRPWCLHTGMERAGEMGLSPVLSRADRMAVAYETGRTAA